MGYVVLASPSEIRLAGGQQLDHRLDKAIKHRVRSNLDTDALSDLVHVGYAKVETNGNITVDLFPQYKLRPIQQL